MAHHGLRELVGTENYNKLLKRLWLEHRESYNDPNTAGVHLSGVEIVVIFGEKVKNKADGEHVWWHEQTHSF